MGKLTGQSIKEAIDSIPEKDWKKFASHRSVGVGFNPPRLLSGTGARDEIRSLKLLELLYPTVDAIVVLVPKNQ